MVNVRFPANPVTRPFNNLSLRCRHSDGDSYARHSSHQPQHRQRCKFFFGWHLTDAGGGSSRDWRMRGLWLRLRLSGFGRRAGCRSQKCSGDCKQVVTTKKGCVAYAIDGRKPCGPNSFANAPRLGEAQNTALKFCYKNGGKDCVIRAWICDAKADP